MIAIAYSAHKGELIADGRSIQCWSKVRNEINGLRPRPDEQDIFRITRSDGLSGAPSMPRPFPIGEWVITGIKSHPDPTDKYLYPFFIATDAHQRLEVWELDKRGFYKSPSGIYCEDYAYGLHFSSSEWTQGCIRIATEADLLYLVDIIRPHLSHESIQFIAEE